MSHSSAQAPFEHYGAIQRQGLGALTPEQVLNLRSQGIDVIAQAAGRVPGVVVPMEGGLDAVYAHVQRHVTGGWWEALLAAVTYEESKGDQHAVSPTGALGPLQLTRYTYGPEAPGGLINPFRWRDSLLRAVDVLNGHLARALAQEGPPGINPLDFALAAYKEGWRGAWRPETGQRGLSYAHRVLAHKAQLEGR